MKKIIITLFLFSVAFVKAQTPQLLNYQGIARDASGTIVTSPIGIQFEILQGSASGTVVYEETNNLTPSSAGIFNTAIGGGTPVIGTFPAINWTNGPYFIRVSIDPAGGTSYSTVSTTQLLSVPYALYAESTKPSTLSISGNSLSINNGNSVTLPAGTSYTAGQGISITGNTITNTAPDATLVPSGISSITGAHPSFTVDVPAPALNYNTGTNVLTLTQGTAVATTTLVGAGSNTVAMFSQGIASVSPVGPGSNFTVSVQSPTFTNVGPTTISGTYPNFVVSSPAASTVVATNLQINSPHTTTTLSAGNYSINVVPTNITGTGVTGTYPNYVVNSPASPTIQINSPNTANTVSVNNYSITVPNTSLTAAGIASVSGTHPAYTVTVPGPSLTVTGNSLTITQGTVVTTKTIAASPWTYTSGVIVPAANNVADKVAIGQNTAASNLDILNQNASGNIAAPVVNINNTNSSFSAPAVLNIKNSAGSGAGLIVDQNTNSSDGLQVNTNSTSNGGNALQVRHFGIGGAGYLEVNNATSSGRILDLNSNGLGIGVSVAMTNSLSSANAFNITTNGTGSGLTIGKTNSGFGLYINHTGNSGNAGAFNINNAASISQALTAQTNGSGDAIAAYNTGSGGRGLYATSAGSVEAAFITNSGTGRALYVNSSNANQSIYVTNGGSGQGLYVLSSGNGTEAGYFVNTSGGGRAVMATQSSSLETVFINNGGSGRGLVVQNSNISAPRAAHIIGGIDVMGKGSSSATWAAIITNSASTNLFNIRDDGNVGIGVTNPGYKLAVTDASSPNSAIFGSNNSAASSGNAHGVSGITSNPNITAAGIHGQNTGAGPAVYGIKMSSSGSAGRFENTLTTNSADALLATTNGGGAAIHAVNGPTVTGGSNAAVWLENGHLKSTASVSPGTTTLTVSGGGISSGTISLSAGSSDVKGTLMAVITTTGQINSGNNIVARVTFNKAYAVAPVVVLTPATDPGLLHPFISAVTPTSFTVTIKNTTPNSMAAAGTFTFNLNYMVIE